MNSTSPEDLERAASLIIAEAPGAALPGQIAAALKAPTNLAIREATAALLAGGREELAERLYQAFWNRSDLGPWARFNMAKLLEQRGEFAPAAAILTEAMECFPKRAVPHWWIARARCERALDEIDDAEATLRRCLALFPESSLAFAALADLLDKSKRAAEATDVWRTLIERFPDEPPTLAHLARTAGERHEWTRALDLWTQCGERHPATMALESAAGRAWALFRLWRIEEALEIWRDLTSRHPDFPLAFRDMATAALEMGDLELARERLEILIARFPKMRKPEWFAQLARCLNDQRDYAAGDLVLAELERLFPDSPLAFRERIRVSKDIEKGQDELTVMIEEAVRRFPGDQGFQATRVWILLGFGRLDEAEAIVKSLEAEESGPHGLISRLRWEADQGGDEHIEAVARRVAAARVWTPADAIPMAEFLLGLWCVWANDLANSLLEDLAPCHPHQIRLACMRARVMIARRDDEKALALIDAIPPPYRRGDVLELRAWAAARRGEHEEAKRLWRVNLASRYFAAVHCPIEGLERLTPEDGAPPLGGVTAYIVYRNEAPQIPAFLRHHRALGVRRFVFIDHESTDNSVELLLSQPDVVLYRCPDSYQLSWSGRRWVNELIDREGAGGWCLLVDADEWFIYPGWETTPIDRFTAYLDATGGEGVRAYMLDVFPNRLLDAAGEPTPQEGYRYYDSDYVWMGQERPPYLHPSGGVRARLFGAKEFLHKTPLWKSDRGLIINSHETTHLRFAEVTGALLHYKLLNVALRGRNARAQDGGGAYLEADSSVDAMRRHSRYAARLSAAWRADLFKPGVSAELADSLTLADRGLMEAPGEYREWLRRERERAPRP